MVVIPSNIKIKATIKKGSVYYFKEASFISNDPHYFVVLNDGPRLDKMLILACASSKVVERKKARKNLPMKTLVEVSSSAYPLFSMDTIFDCNSILEKSIQDLVEKLDNGKLQICSQEMPGVIVDLLIKGALLSPLVSKRDKKIIQ